jgi:hypothetical protein
MGRIFWGKRRWLGGALLGFCLLAAVLLRLPGYFPGHRAAAAAEKNRYEVQSQLLMEALRQVGPCGVGEAAGIWANGLKTRNAAVQYAAMTNDLKEEYARQLEETAPYWVTGMSSPWVESYRIVRESKMDKDRHTVELAFSTMTSTGPAEGYRAALTIVAEDGFWRIAAISMDEGLVPYTGFSADRA